MTPTAIAGIGTADDDRLTLDADVIAELVREAGYFAYVEQTGGGCATIYAGERIPDEEREFRYAVAAGPGQYGWGERPSTFHLSELYVGPDSWGDEEAMDAYQVGCRDEQDVADLIVLNLHQPGPAYLIPDFDTTEAHGFDGTARGIERRRPDGLAARLRRYGGERPRSSDRYGRPRRMA